MQQGVRDTELRIEDEREQHALRGRRDHERHEDERAVEADEPDPPVQRERERSPPTMLSGTYSAVYSSVLPTA